jgi:chemotaxis protein MotB
MARRRKKHEDHVNHEAWAIPYGDLITLLLAFFVVMYSMSSVNEGKYRILSDSLVAAFRGAPKTIAPVNLGEEATGKGGDKQLQGVSPTQLMKLPDTRPIAHDSAPPPPPPPPPKQALHGALVQMARDVELALQELIDKKLVVVRREQFWIEVEIRTDILFPSGVADVSKSAQPVLVQLAGILKPFPNPVRVEGHTDNVPVKGRAFRSNWELSAARAGSVVHTFTTAGIDPKRLEIIGLGEYRPIADNATAEGRNTNRRVRVVILENFGQPEDVYAAARRKESEAVAAQSGQQLAEPGNNRHLFAVPPEALQPGTAAGAATPAPQSATQVPPAAPPKEIYKEPSRQSPTTTP